MEIKSNKEEILGDAPLIMISMKFNQLPTEKACNILGQLFQGGHKHPPGYGVVSTETNYPTTAKVIRKQITWAVEENVIIICLHYSFERAGNSLDGNLEKHTKIDASGVIAALTSGFSAFD